MDKKLKRKHRPGRGPTIFVSVIGIIMSIALLTVGVLYMCGVTTLEGDGPRYYEVNFYTLDNELYYSNTYRKGAKLDKISDPSYIISDGFKYSFIGWDYTGEGIADILPEKVYFPINAHALYSTVYVGGIL